MLSTNSQRILRKYANVSIILEHDKYRLFCITVRYPRKRFKQWNVMARSMGSIIFRILGQLTLKKLKRITILCFHLLKTKVLMQFISFDVKFNYYFTRINYYVRTECTRNSYQCFFIKLVVK